MLKMLVVGDMESTLTPNTSSSAASTSTTDIPREFVLSDYVETHILIIVLPSAFICLFLIVLFILLIRKIIHRQRSGFNPKQLETYSSVSYDDESADDDELEDTHDDFMYTSCRLLVGDGYEDDPNAELTNSEPEYDCLSVDVTVSAKESAVLGLRTKDDSLGTSQEVSQSLKTLPKSFWKR